MKNSVDNILKNIIEINGVVAIAAQATKFEIYDFDFRRYFETRSLMSETTLPLILRIGAIEDYKKTFNELKSEGLQLINSIEQHERASLLPNWYPLIKDYTARSKVYEVMPALQEIMNDFEFPIFIKGERQTNKHKKSLCVAENRSELEHILQTWNSDPILNWQRVICRQFIQLQKIDDNLNDQLQFSNEHRVFLWRNKVVGIGQYWTAARSRLLNGTEMNEVIRLAEEIAVIVNIPFLVIDIGKQIDGKWIVIELNDAQESGYAGVSKLQLWEQILKIEELASI